MTPERWNQVGDLFRAALEKKPHERTAFLDAACADDQGLRGEVESLLAEHERAGDFLHNPASSAAASALRDVLQDDKSLPAEPDPYIGMILANRYQVEAKLASGGQALVYRALDMAVMSKPVVIKILHTASGHNAWQRKKFQHEMEALARIDHPGIVGILDTGELPDGKPFLVVQYIDGVTLRQQLKDGPLNHVRAAALLRQIGAALSASHANGIAHRDLKPENIMLQRLSDGSELVKLIDFGIAKIEKSALGPNTTTVMVEGTVRYMAPEQFQGENSSASDIYALGLIACEMLCGQPDFLTVNAPPHVRDHIRKALAFRPADRPEEASAFCNDLAEALTRAPDDDEREEPPVFVQRARAAWLIAALLMTTLAVSALWYFRESSPQAGTVELSLAPPEGTTLDEFVLSPDGRQIAAVATDSTGRAQLWLRPLASHSFQQLAGTEGASSPFWSPDSRFIAFFSGGKLKKIESSGGLPQTICNAETGSRGGTWNQDGVILFTPNPATSLYRVPATGGDPRPVTTLDASREESSHDWPQFLPDGHHFLFFNQSGNQETSGIYIASLDSGERRRVLQTNSSGLYASGYLLFLREGTLLAQPLDRHTLQVTGAALPVADRVGVVDVSSRSVFSVSDTGLLAYAPTGPTSHTQLLWLDRTGRHLGTVPSTLREHSTYSNVDLSPDGSGLAVDRRDPQTGMRDVWLFDLVEGGQSRLTFNSATDASPAWSPDGRRLAFFSTRDGVWNLYQKNATGLDDDALLLKSDESKITCDWSADGQYILFRQWDAKTKWDLWALPIQSDGKPLLIVRTPFEEGCAQLSPDGHWLAYVSGESGHEEVYVQPFSPHSQRAGRWQVSPNGGTGPRWRRDGKELFFMSLDGKMTAVPVSTGTTFRAGSPKPLFPTHSAGFLRYDVTADGQRFLVNTAIEKPDASIPTIVLNWTAQLQRADSK